MAAVAVAVSVAVSITTNTSSTVSDTSAVGSASSSSSYYSSISIGHLVGQQSQSAVFINAVMIQCDTAVVGVIQRVNTVAQAVASRCALLSEQLQLVMHYGEWRMMYNSLVVATSQKIFNHLTSQQLNSTVADDLQHAQQHRALAHTAAIILLPLLNSRVSALHSKSKETSDSTHTKKISNITTRSTRTFDDLKWHLGLWTSDREILQRPLRLCAPVA
eukprot:2061-Heterococcus_DN1.PRE.2